MPGTPPFVGPIRGLVHRFQEWPVASQQQARRNAMIAATDCAERRAQREDVADFLASRTRTAASSATPTAATPRRSSHA